MHLLLLASYPPKHEVGGHRYSVEGSCSVYDPPGSPHVAFNSPHVSGLFGHFGFLRALAALLFVHGFMAWIASSASTEQ